MSVTVRRERPDQRRHHRVTAPLRVTVGEHCLRAADWSLGGLRLEGYPGAIPTPGTALDLKLALPFQGFDVSLRAKGEVVRTDPAKAMFALKFTELGEREQEVMRHFIEGLVRGSMSNVADTIQRIDLPVTPVSTAPDVNPKDAVPLTRWPIKTIFYSTLYGLLGFFVFSYVAMMAYTNIFRLEVDAAVISAPLVTFEAANEGHVLWAGVKPGDLIKGGTTVLQVADNGLEQSIDLADLDIRDRKAKLEALRHQMVEAMNQLEDLASVETKQIEQAKLKLDGLRAIAVAADEQYKRTQGLFEKGYATKQQLELAERDAVASSTAAQGQASELSSQSALAGRQIGDRFFTGNQILGERAKLESELKLQEEEVRIGEQHKEVLVKQRQRLAVIAPFDGLILDMPRVDHASVNRGDVIAILEQPRSRTVTAYLTQSEIMHVGVGDEATVYVPAFDATLRARVASIDRTSGFADNIKARFTWRGPLDRSAMVTLEFLDHAAVSAPQTFRSGTPVTVIFQSRSTNEVVNQVVSAFNVLPKWNGDGNTPLDTYAFRQKPTGMGDGAAPAEAAEPAKALRPSLGAPAFDAAPPVLRPSQGVAPSSAAVDPPTTVKLRGT